MASSSLTSAFSRPVISTADAARVLGLDASASSSSVTVLDASWYLPAAGRDGKQEFASRRIPGASYFDINGPGLSDTSSSLPHMLPTESDFAPTAAALGITKQKPVIVYDGAGLFSAARVWWTLRAFGHEHVSVLEGGFPKWLAEGRPIEAGPCPPRTPAPVEEWKLKKDLVYSMPQIHDVIAQRKASSSSSSDSRSLPLVLDARPRPRFEGAAPEPRPGCQSGHMPFSRSVPAASLLDEKAFNTLLPKEQLMDVFLSNGVDLSRPGRVVASCGSGVTAAIVYLALVSLGRPLDTISLYDGSWAEYGSNKTNEILPGAADAADAKAL